MYAPEEEPMISRPSKCTMHILKRREQHFFMSGRLSCFVLKTAAEKLKVFSLHALEYGPNVGKSIQVVIGTDASTL